MGMKYHIWTEGCQMNVADSLRVASSLEALEFKSTPRAEDADVIVLNTCVVRQSAEDKAYGRLSSLRPLKEKHPELIINLMGCLVGVKAEQTHFLLSMLPGGNQTFTPTKDNSINAVSGEQKSNAGTCGYIRVKYSGGVQHIIFLGYDLSSLQDSNISIFIPEVNLSVGNQRRTPNRRKRVVRPIVLTVIHVEAVEKAAEIRSV